MIPVALFVGNILDYFCIESPSLSDTRIAYVNALGIAVFTAVYVVLVHIGNFIGLKLGMQLRIIGCTALYDKVSNK